MYEQYCYDEQLNDIRAQLAEMTDLLQKIFDLMKEKTTESDNDNKSGKKKRINSGGVNELQ
jgi:hypothetical protein